MFERAPADGASGLSERLGIMPLRSRYLFPIEALGTAQRLLGRSDHRRDSAQNPRSRCHCLQPRPWFASWSKTRIPHSHFRARK